MNIPGPQKVSPLIRIGFEEGVRRLEKALVGAGIPILFIKSSIIRPAMKILCPRRGRWNRERHCGTP